MIYLDSAATTFQKPPSVERAMNTALRTMSSPGRGGHFLAMRAAETAFQCRNELAQMFHAEGPEQVVFTMNATHALNIAIKSLVPPGGKVVISGYEHNAVTRPLLALGANITVASAPLFNKAAAISAFQSAITAETDAVICNHVSNVFGCIQPVEEIAGLCRRTGVPFIVDASQSAGMIPLNMRELEAAFIAMPGHKGLYGPQGTGVLLCGNQQKGKTLLEGGTGSQSLRQEMPLFLPDRLEAGTHNMPGIAGLLAGVRFVNKIGIKQIYEKEKHLTDLTLKTVRRVNNVRVFSSAELAQQTGVISILPISMDAEEVGMRLGERGIAVRAGLHCAPLAHESAKTIETGTIRLSFSVFNNSTEVYRAMEELQQILHG